MGADFNEIIDAHPRVIRSRHPRAGRLPDVSFQKRHPTRPRRTHQGHRTRTRPHGPRRGHPHLRAIRCRAVRSLFRHPDDQRAHRRRTPVPDPRRPSHDPRKTRHLGKPQDRIHRRWVFQHDPLVDVGRQAPRLRTRRSLTASLPTAVGISRATRRAECLRQR